MPKVTLFQLILNLIIWIIIIIDTISLYQIKIFQRKPKRLTKLSDIEELDKKVKLLRHEIECKYLIFWFRFNISKTNFFFFIFLLFSFYPVDRKIDQPDQKILRDSGNKIELIPSSISLLKNKELKKHFDSSRRLNILDVFFNNKTLLVQRYFFNDNIYEWRKHKMYSINQLFIRNEPVEAFIILIDIWIFSEIST